MWRFLESLCCPELEEEESAPVYVVATRANGITVGVYRSEKAAKTAAKKAYFQTCITETIII